MGGIWVDEISSLEILANTLINANVLILSIKCLVYYLSVVTKTESNINHSCSRLIKGLYIKVTVYQEHKIL